MTDDDGIDVAFVLSDSVPDPIPKRVAKATQSDEYEAEAYRSDAVSLYKDDDNSYLSVTVATHDADSDWYTLPSMSALSLGVSKSKLGAGDFEQRMLELLGHVEHVYLSINRCQYAYGLDSEHTSKINSDSGPGIPVSQESLADNRIEAVSWLMVFSPELVEEYGHEWLLSAPAWERRELDDGAIMLVASPDPTDWNEAAAACQDLANYFDLPR